jgi:Rieske Fe-S protein
VNVAPAGPAHAVNAGPASRYIAEGVYGDFRDQGFFIVNRGGRVFALSSYCTHRKCKLTAEADRTFYCDCHGSEFDPSGKVTEGPATRSLPVFPSSTDAHGNLIVMAPA